MLEKIIKKVRTRKTQPKVGAVDIAPQDIPLRRNNDGSVGREIHPIRHQ